MKCLLILIPFLISCGGDDILNPVEKKPESIDIPGVITVLEEEKPSTNTPSTTNQEETCPDSYRDRDFILLTCREGSALVAIGYGCSKSLRLLEGEEAEEVCK